jgi:D-alanyl-D-alanine carboxypeptidase
MKKFTTTLLLLSVSVALLSGCDASKKFFAPAPQTQTNSKAQASDSSPSAQSADPAQTSGSSQPAQSAEPVQKVDTTPDSITVLVNKQFALPKEYAPSDLVNDPDIPFIFSGYDERRLMRKEMAEALKKMFAAAKQDGIQLAGVSAYRSYATQEALFQYYVQRDGLEKAKTYSAAPGTSEHMTGLAIDVSGADGKCAAEDCFGETKEAKWIAEHAAEYGFIVRYPKGKEAITGYQYEPWHLRYVGKPLAEEITKRGITLEEYYNAIPVSK